ncbi:MAG: hypothetical protein MZU91_10620 [Desulfosudis oleivorans]|nr:hypothetical protein [Desulfosudis oleivorans]
MPSPSSAISQLLGDEAVPRLDADGLRVGAGREGRVVEGPRLQRFEPVADGARERGEDVAPSLGPQRRRRQLRAAPTTSRRTRLMATRTSTRLVPRRAPKLSSVRSPFALSKRGVVPARPKKVSGERAARPLAARQRARLIA